MFCKSPLDFQYRQVAVLIGTVFLSGCTMTGLLTNQGLGLPADATVTGVTSAPLTAAISNPSQTPQNPLNTSVVTATSGLELTENERQAMLKAEFEALEYTPAGHPVKWRSPTTGNYGEVTAFQTYDVGAANCRRYTHRLIINGKPETIGGAACKEQDGTWEPLT